MAHPDPESSEPLDPNESGDLPESRGLGELAEVTEVPERGEEENGHATASEAATAAEAPVAAGPSHRPSLLRAWFGGTVQRRLSRWSDAVDKAESHEPRLLALSDHALRKESLSLRYRAKSGEPLERLIPEAFALVREAGRRTLGMRHFRVQFIGGLALCNRSIAEMQTGEGKTLTATLPLYLYALAGRGAHLATVNDYLAERDAKWMSPIYRFLGVSVGTVLTEMDQDDRRKAYHCDITYGTAKEFGFDFLRDRLLLRRIRDLQPGFLSTEESGGERPVQRDPYFCLVDEADSILIDEARTPLIISSIPGPAQEAAVACFAWSAEVCSQFEEDVHYEYDHEKKSIELNAQGRALVRLLPKPPQMDAVGLVEIYEYIERAIKVIKEFELDRDYVVHEGEIVIVDENTGRMAAGRKWRDGIHQAIEAKEKIKIGVPTGQAARVTVQDYFLRYEHLAGMTGTAVTSAREIRKIYKMQVVPIPTNRPSKRKILPDRVFSSAEAKWTAIVEEVQRMHAMNRPVLIGTRSIDKSLVLSQLLTTMGIEHEVLNAHQVAREAEIVARAGESGRVTVATNMAGRGTDIKLGEGVKDMNGLHVICTELHNSARIDRQLIGRCGRQGDPGSVQFFLAMDDDIIKVAYGPKKADRFAQRGKAGEHKDFSRYAPSFRRAQRRVERLHLKQRQQLLHHERQRKKMQLEMGHDPYLNTAE